jgi:hypothetical protein
MRQPRVENIGFTSARNLGYSSKSAESRAVKNPIPIPLKWIPLILGAGVPSPCAFCPWDNQRSTSIRHFPGNKIEVLSKYNSPGF